MKVPCVLQTDLRDCGVSCLMSIIKYYHGYVTREYLREITNTTDGGVSVYSLVECADTLGFESMAIKDDILKLKDKLPLIAHVIINNMGHFVVIEDIDSKTIKIMDPKDGFRKYKIDEWNKITTNVYILYKPKNNILKQSNNNSLFKLMVPILNKYKITLLIVLFFSSLYIISSIVISYGFKFFINYNIYKIKYIFILLVILVILKEITNIFKNKLINYFNHSVGKTFLKEIYNHIIKLPYLYFKNRMKGDVITRINDIFKIRDFISKLFITITIDLLFIIVILIIIFNINKNIGLIIVLITLIYILIIIIYDNLIINNIKKIKENEIDVNNYLIESISSIDTIKGNVLEDLLNDKLDIKYDKLQVNSFNLNNKLSLKNSIKEIFKSLLLIMIIYLCINNSIDISIIFVLYNLYYYYFEPIDNIVDIYLEYKDINISFIRIKELLDIECEELNISKKSLNKRLIGDIKIDNLEYSYNGIDDILKCKSLTIKESNKVLLYGTSGGGKSTLIKILVRYLNKYKGNIYINGRDLKTYNLLDIRNKITYISQDEIIYTDTIYNNINLNNKVNYTKYLEIINLCGVDKIINKSILGDDLMLDNNGYSLSGGERQRIIIARSLVKNSDIYIYDEATSALDIKSERILLENIFNYLKNKTIIIISHRFNNRDLYQKFIMVKGGIVYEY